MNDLVKMIVSKTIERDGEVIPVGSEVFIPADVAGELIRSRSAEPWVPLSSRYPHKTGMLWIRTQIDLILAGCGHFKPGNILQVAEDRAHRMVDEGTAIMVFEVDRRA